MSISAVSYDYLDLYTYSNVDEFSILSVNLDVNDIFTYSAIDTMDGITLTLYIIVDELGLVPADELGNPIGWG
jgi:hypothetical protein